MGQIKETYLNNMSQQEYEDMMESYESIDSLTDDEPIPVEVIMKDPAVEGIEMMVKALEMNMKVLKELKARIVDLEKDVKAMGSHVIIMTGKLKELENE